MPDSSGIFYFIQCLTILLIFSKQALNDSFKRLCLWILTDGWMNGEKQIKRVKGNHLHHMAHIQRWQTD